jgi:poly-beta-1,6-N-acetyl-D-glucosamine synthase
MSGSLLFVIILAGVYACCLALLYISWKSVKRYPMSLGSLPSVSVVVAFRNEEQHLPALLNALMKQDYPLALLEFIFVNDHSEDQFEQVFETSTRSAIKVSVLSLPAGITGKKQALSFGIQAAQGEWIMTTDADCTLGSEWVKTMISHAVQSGARFVFGPVGYHRNRGWFGEAQAIELSSLVGSGAALWQLGYPTMCNGANLLYKKELVQGAALYQKNAHLASGDDEFLMHQVFHDRPKDVSFVKNPEALVETMASSTWLDFYHQRKRWASKWGGYQLLHVKVVALLVFMLNAFYVFLPCLLFWDQTLMPWILIAYLVRWLLDGIFLQEIICFYDKPFNLVSYVGVALVYPHYVLVSALSGRFGKYHWKGRTVQ